MLWAFVQKVPGSSLPPCIWLIWCLVIEICHYRLIIKYSPHLEPVSGGRWHWCACIIACGQHRWQISLSLSGSETEIKISHLILKEEIIKNLLGFAFVQVLVNGSMEDDQRPVSTSLCQFSSYKCLSSQCLSPTEVVFFFFSFFSIRTLLI